MGSETCSKTQFMDTSFPGKIADEAYPALVPANLSVGLSMSKSAQVLDNIADATSRRLDQDPGCVAVLERLELTLARIEREMQHLISVGSTESGRSASAQMSKPT